MGSYIALAFGIAFATLALAAAFRYLRRLRSLRRGAGIRVDDDLIQQIERSGRIELDEPLDMEEIREAEERFWNEEPWTEPDEL